MISLLPSKAIRPTQWIGPSLIVLALGFTFWTAAFYPIELIAAVLFFVAYPPTKEPIDGERALRMWFPPSPAYCVLVVIVWGVISLFFGWHTTAGVLYTIMLCFFLLAYHALWKWRRSGKKLPPETRHQVDRGVKYVALAALGLLALITFIIMAVIHPWVAFLMLLALIAWFVYRLAHPKKKDKDED